MTRPEIIKKLRRLESTQEYHAEVYSNHGDYTAADHFRRFAAETAAIRTLLQLHTVRELRKDPIHPRTRRTPQSGGLPCP